MIILNPHNGTCKPGFSLRFSKLGTLNPLLIEKIMSAWQIWGVKMKKTGCQNAQTWCLKKNLVNIGHFMTYHQKLIVLGDETPSNKTSDHSLPGHNLFFKFPAAPMSKNQWSSPWVGLTLAAGNAGLSLPSNTRCENMPF